MNIWWITDRFCKFQNIEQRHWRAIKRQCNLIYYIWSTHICILLCVKKLWYPASAYTNIPSQIPHRSDSISNNQKCHLCLVAADSNLKCEKTTARNAAGMHEYSRYASASGGWWRIAVALVFVPLHMGVMDGSVHVYKCSLDEIYKEVNILWEKFR